MKLNKLRLKIATGLAITTAVNFSCKKETTYNPARPEEPTAANSNRPDEPGFAQNDMVMYWNEKSALVLGEHTNPGNDARSFAIIQIAVHDALNGIRPK